DLVVRVELEDSRDQVCVELAAEQRTLDVDGDGADADDRELAALELPDVDLDPFDRAAELEGVRHPLDRGDARRHSEDEVRRVGLDVRPLDPDRLDLDRQPVDPPETGAVRVAEREEDAKPVQRLERAVAEE